MISRALVATLAMTSSTVGAANFDVLLTRSVDPIATPSHQLMAGGDLESQIDLSPTGTVAYTGPVFLGTPLQGNASSTFLYDSGSQYLLVTGSNCTTCGSQYYNPNLSTTTRPSTEYTLHSMFYGNASFGGYMLEDDVCLSDFEAGSTCAKSFPLFVIDRQTNMNDEIDGVLGLGPKGSGNGPSFVSYLSEQGVIAQPVVSFQITPDTSVAQFGYVDAQSYTGSITYHEHVAAQGAWWTLNLNGAKYGSTNIKSSNWRYAIVDSGTQMIFMALPDYQNFVAQVKKGGKRAANFDCDSRAYCFTDVDCKRVENDLSDLVITLDSTDYSVPPYGYLLQDYAEGATCAIAVSYLGILQNQYVLGDTFIKNFYSTFNYETSTIGLAQNANGPVSYAPKIRWYGWFLIIVAVLLVIAAAVFGVCYYRGRGIQSSTTINTSSEGLIGFDGNEVGEEKLGAEKKKRADQLGPQVDVYDEDDPERLTVGNTGM